MVQQESRLKVADNTEQRSFNYPCFRRYKRRYASVKIVVSIKDTTQTEALKKELFQLQLLYVPEKK
jgi:ribosomal protein L14